MDPRRDPRASVWFAGLLAATGVVLALYLLMQSIPVTPA